MLKYTQRSIQTFTQWLQSVHSVLFQLIDRKNTSSLELAPTQEAYVFADAGFTLNKAQ